MPIEFGLWRLDSEAVEAVPPAQLQNEAQLESVIEQRVEILGLGQLLILGRQVVTDYGKKIDLLAMDGQGDLYLIELKRPGRQETSSRKHWNTAGGSSPSAGTGSAPFTPSTTTRPISPPPSTSISTARSLRP
jgi:hypothetical protein